MRFVFLNNDREVFDVQNIDAKAYCGNLFFLFKKFKF